MEKSKVKKLYTGVVIADKMNKTITVKVAERRKHPFYEKVFSKRKKFKVHDENEQAHVGDVVQFCPSRPFSKTKRMSLVRIVRSVS